MIDSLNVSPGFATFLIASLILAITPGPGVLYILTRTLGHGRRAGLASIGGIAAGNLANSAIASLGLAVVVAESSAGLAVVRVVGAAYLVFLGVQALRSKRVVPAALPRGRQSDARIFREGFLVALLNPKTALFFAAFLPQFIRQDAAPLPQTLLLGAVFVAIALCTDTAYVFTAAGLGPVLRKHSKRPYGRYLSAATFFGLGVYAALAAPRAVK